MTMEFCTVLSYTIIYSVLFSDGIATSFACATHLQSRTSGYPIHCFFLRGDGHLLNLSQGVDIPSCFSFWRMDCHLRHVLYYNVLYCIIPYYQLLQGIPRYDTIIHHVILYCSILDYMIMYCTILYHNVQCSF